MKVENQAGPRHIPLNFRAVVVIALVTSNCYAHVYDAVGASLRHAVVEQFCKDTMHASRSRSHDRAHMQLITSRFLSEMGVDYSKALHDEQLADLMSRWVARLDDNEFIATQYTNVLEQLAQIEALIEQNTGDDVIVGELSAQKKALQAAACNLEAEAGFPLLMLVRRAEQNEQSSGKKEAALAAVGVVGGVAVVCGVAYAIHRHRSKKNPGGGGGKGQIRLEDESDSEEEDEFDDETVNDSSVSGHKSEGGTFHKHEHTNDRTVAWWEQESNQLLKEKKFVDGVVGAKISTALRRMNDLLVDVYDANIPEMHVSGPGDTGPEPQEVRTLSHVQGLYDFVKILTRACGVGNRDKENVTEPSQVPTFSKPAKFARRAQKALGNFAELLRKDDVTPYKIAGSKLGKKDRKKWADNVCDYAQSFRILEHMLAQENYSVNWQECVAQWWGKVKGLQKRVDLKYTSKALKNATRDQLTKKDQPKARRKLSPWLGLSYKQVVDAWIDGDQIKGCAFNQLPELSASELLTESETGAADGDAEKEGEDGEEDEDQGEGSTQNG